LEREVTLFTAINSIKALNIDPGMMKNAYAIATGLLEGKSLDEISETRKCEYIIEPVPLTNIMPSNKDALQRIVPLLEGLSRDQLTKPAYTKPAFTKLGYASLPYREECVVVITLE